jgi:hypothetical protein
MDTASIESRIDGFLGKYTPEIEAQLRDARTRLRALFPRGFELVFDNYNALVFGFSPSERSADAFLSIAGYPKWTTLFFLHGIDLHDPGRLLQGDGRQVRSIRLKAASEIHSLEVAALIAEAMRRHASALLAAPPLTTLIKMAVPKQRPRRPASTASVPPSSGGRAKQK